MSKYDDQIILTNVRVVSRETGKWVLAEHDAITWRVFIQLCSQETKKGVIDYWAPVGMAIAAGYWASHQLDVHMKSLGITLSREWSMR